MAWDMDGDADGDKDCDCSITIQTARIPQIKNQKINILINSENLIGECFEPIRIVFLIGQSVFNVA
jgi:hypothetical protein